MCHVITTLDLSGNGQHKSTNKLLFLVPHHVAPWEFWKYLHAAAEGPELQKNSVNEGSQRHNGARRR